MSAKKTRKRAYIPPSHEVVNRRERTETTRTHRTTAPRTARGGSGAAAREFPVPSWRRTLRRLPMYALAIFAMQYFLLGQEGKLDTAQRLAAAAGFALLITICFAPFMHVMDKAAYNRHLKRTGAADAAEPKR